MPEVAALVWLPAYSVGVELLDRQHRRRLELCQAVATITAQEEDFRSAILPSLEQMHQYAQEHFRTEETLLAEQQHPDMETQKRERQAYTDALAEFIFSASLKSQGPQAVRQFSTGWWLQHILQSDMAYKALLADAKRP